MTNELTEIETNFVRAVRANNYAVIELSPNMSLITDWEREEEFNPWIAIEDDDIDEEDIRNVMADIDIFDYEELHIETQTNVSIDFGEFSEVEFNYSTEVQNE